MESIRITARQNKLSSSVQLPLSKSISNRGLIISALSEGKATNVQLSDSDDTVLLAQLLEQLNEGKHTELNCHNAGTVLRFLTAYLSITPGEWILKGDERMHQRPIDPLVQALQELGAEIEYTKDEGSLPLRIKGKRLQGGNTSIMADISSQFISALMMIGPMMQDGLELICYEPFSSLPYIEMTARVMKAAGAELVLDMPNIRIKGTGYKESVLPFETDWSSAAHWYALMALAKDGELMLQGLKEDSLQGDSVTHSYFKMLGIETTFENEGARIRKHFWKAAGFNFMMKDHPDLAPSMIVTTAAKGFEGNFYGLENLKIKESDRVQSLINELAKCSIECSYEDGQLSFQSQKIKIKKAIDTYNDHRIAMAFAPLAMLGQPLTINNPSVVNKSYPAFWSELQKVLDVEC